VKPVWPFRHVWLKLLSVGLALSLWMLVSGQETVERGVRVPLEIQQFPAGLELMGELPATVDVRLRGASASLSRLAPGDVVAVLDVHGARPGRRLFPLTPEQVRVPFGIEVEQVTPSTVAIAFENSATARVPVHAETEGKPAPGFVMGKVIIEPAWVEIVGPETAVKHATAALTEPIVVSGADHDLVENVTVGLGDPALRLKSPRPELVTIIITPAPAEHTLRRIPVHLRNLGPALTAEATPSLVDVSIRGSRDAVTHLEADDVAAYVDLAGLGAGEYTLTVHGEGSDDAGVIRTDPSSVKVRISSVKE
jgi:YbbR domain-containing protein